VVLFSILLGAGAGGFFQQRLKGALAPAFLAAAALLLAAHLPVSGAIMDRAVGLPVAGRGALSALLVFVPAFFMGTAFPRGLRAFSAREGAGAAWMWGVNGAASVAGSLASMVLSLLYGTNAALWCAALLYLAAAVLLRRLEGDHAGPEAPGKS